VAEKAAPTRKASDDADASVRTRIRSEPGMTVSRAETSTVSGALHCMEARMPRTRLMTAVPHGSDQTVYLVADDVGSLDRVGGETNVEIDLETLISDLIAGRFNDPIRIVAVDASGYWSNDVSNEIAKEIQACCDIEAMPVPEHIRDFVENHTCEGAVAPFTPPRHDLSGARWQEASARQAGLGSLSIAEPGALSAYAR